MVSRRLTSIGAGSVLTFVISLGTAIPLVGIFFGPVFTFGGGFVGGSIGGFLFDRGPDKGGLIGIAVALLGGALSSVVVITGNALFRFLVESQGTGATRSAGLLAFQVFDFLLGSAIGFVTGLVFTVLGGLVGGLLGGTVADL